MRSISCYAFCFNSGDEPDVFEVVVTLDEDAISNGEHYDAAMRSAQDEGYHGPMCVYDEDDIRSETLQHALRRLTV